MHLNNADDILRAADSLVRRCGSRDPDVIAAELGITVIETAFKTLKGAYKVIERNRYIFLKNDLEDPMRRIVLLHEIGHDRLHRKQAAIFQEFNLFDMDSNIMEYEANLFASHIMLPDDEIISCIEQGMSAAQIAAWMCSDINLVALKAADLAGRGHAYRIPEYRNKFLK